MAEVRATLRLTETVTVCVPDEVCAQGREAVEEYVSDRLGHPWGELNVFSEKLSQEVDVRLPGED